MNTGFKQTTGQSRKRPLDPVSLTGLLLGLLFLGFLGYKAMSIPLLELRYPVLQSMAPLDLRIDRTELRKSGQVMPDWQREFVIFADRNAKPQPRAAVPFQYGYVDLPRADGHVGEPMLDGQAKSALLARNDQSQAEGDVYLYADAQGQSQIVHVNERLWDGIWEWDVTLPEKAEGLIVALWLYGGPNWTHPEGYQFEFDIEIMGGGRRGPRIEANFHDGKGPSLNFGTLNIDWSHRRMHFRIEQSLTEGYCEIYADGKRVGRITRAEVEAAGRKWPDVPSYSSTDMWIVNDGTGESARGLQQWAGLMDPNMDLRKLTVHGYQVTPKRTRAK